MFNKFTLKLNLWATILAWYYAEWIIRSLCNYELCAVPSWIWLPFQKRQIKHCEMTWCNWDITKNAVIVNVCCLCGGIILMWQNIAQLFGRGYVHRILVVVDSVSDFGVVNSVHVLVTPKILLRPIVPNTMRRCSSELWISLALCEICEISWFPHWNIFGIHLLMPVSKLLDDSCQIIGELVIFF